MSTSRKAISLWDKIESLHMNPYFVWWVLAFTGYINSLERSFLTRRAADKFKADFIEKRRDEILSPERRKMIEILSTLQASDISDKFKVRLSEICGSYNKEVRRAEQITARKAGSILKSLRISTRKGARGYTYALCEKKAIKSLRDKAVNSRILSAKQLSKEADVFSKFYANLRLSENLMILQPASPKPSHRPAHFSRYLAIFYLREYFKKCTGHYHMETIERIMKLSMAVERGRSELVINATVSNIHRTGAGSYSFKKLNFESVAKCCYISGVDQKQISKIARFADGRLVRKINTALSTTSIVRWDKRKPELIERGIDINGNPLLTLDQHLGWYERHKDKIHKALQTGERVIPLFNKQRPNTSDS